MEKLTIIQPDDWHLHVRSGSILKAVIPPTAKQFSRAIIMPNLNPPITTVDQALEYRKEILRAVPAPCNFQPLMTLYLTNATSVSDVQAAAAADAIHAFKLYPAGATTNSESGVTSLAAIYPVLEAMQKHDLPLLIHGEVTDKEVDIFDRESVFIDTILAGLVADFPGLRIVLEHVTTREAVQFVTAAADNMAATITPQHLLLNRNAILAGGIRPHNYCLPVLKRESHRQTLVNAAISGNHKFFLGTDSAPHLKHLKESCCGCAGCYSAPAALALYAEVFEQANALDKLEGFASLFGADFYRMPRNTTTISLIKRNWKIPDSYLLGADQLVPLYAGESINWQIQP